MSVPILAPPEQRWACPNCDLEEVTRGRFLPNRFHHCRGAGQFAGLWAPMVPAGTRAKVETREREDFIGAELVQLHQGRPVMSVQTTRDDGVDCAVFAPAAVARKD